MANLVTMPRYEKYKDSGVEWLGEIPDHWEITRLKNTIYGCTNGFWGSDPTGKDEIIVIRVADFDDQNLTISDHKLTLRSVSKKDRHNRQLQHGDLIIEKSGGGDKTLVGRVVLFDKKYSALTSNFLAKMTPRDWVNNRFLKYVFFSLYSRKINYLSIKQTTGIQNLDASSYLNEIFCFPQNSEQTLIADYLDYKTAQIDEAIAIKEKQIELLKERKQIIIQKAVTQGLDPNVKMKDSGVDWIGEIPEHWEVKKLKYLINFVGGGTPSKENSSYWNGDICWVSPKDMKTEYISNTIDKITEKALKNSSVKLIPENTVLIVVRGMILAKKIPVAITTKELTINQDMKGMLIKSGCNAEYLRSLLDGLHEELSTILEESGHGTKTMPTEKLGNFKLPFPSYDEQNQIIEYIQAESMKINTIISTQQSQIQKLKEYKTTLIDSAVTGKIKITPEMVG